jgi:hypothetical protein
MRDGSPLMTGSHDAAFHDSADLKLPIFRQFLVQQMKTNSKTTWVCEATEKCVIL